MKNLLWQISRDIKKETLIKMIFDIWYKTDLDYKREQGMRTNQKSARKKIRLFSTVFPAISKLMILFGLFSIFLLSDTVAAFNSNQDTKAEPKGSSNEIEICKGVVKRGETATSLFKNYLTLSSIYEMDRQSRKIFPLTRLRNGHPYKLVLKDNHLIEFEYEIDKNNMLVIQNRSGNFLIDKQSIQYDTIVEVVSSDINDSLFEAVRKSGERGELAWKLSEIFAWDINFIRDIRQGDSFRVLVEKQYRDGKLSGYGNILAAFFTNKGVVFKAFWHQSGYYDENGRSLQKTFLKAPLAFSRITSKFTKKRFHPVLKIYRPHHGIDYAASRGTPVKSVGDGTIEKIGFNKEKGNFIKIRHTGGYATSYYHLNRFAKGMGKNKQVLQGDIIGYVGMTGFATGPHLCFRMTKNGRHLDPLKHISSPAKPVNALEMEQYISKTENLTNKLLSHQLAALKK